VRRGGLTIAVAKLSARSAAKAGGSLVVPADSIGAEVVVPASTFRKLGVEGVAIIVTAFDSASTSTLNGGAMQNESEEVSPGLELSWPTEVQAVANVHLASLATGEFLNVSGLAEPIKVVLPVNRSDALKCAFWDEQRSVWSGDGVSVDKSVPGILQSCKTTHLTLFGAIWMGFTATLTCSQVTLINLEAISELAALDWCGSTGATVFFTVLGVLLLTTVSGLFVECRRWRAGGWTDEDFLIPMSLEMGDQEAAEDGPVEEEGQQEGEAQPCWSLLACMYCMTVGACGTFFQWCRTSSALRDAVDDVLSNWFKNFSEFRDFVEGFCEGLDLAGAPSGAAGGRVFVLVHRIMSSLLVSSARRQAAASLKVGDDVVAFIIDDEVLPELLLRRADRRKASEREAYRCHCQTCDRPTGTTWLGLWCTRCNRWWHLTCVERRVAEEDGGGPERVRQARLACLPSNEPMMWLCPPCWCRERDALEAEAARSNSIGSEGSVREREEQPGDMKAKQLGGIRHRRTGALDLALSEHREETWGQLHEAVCDAVERHFLRTTRCCQLPCIIWRLFLVQNPFGASIVRSMFMPAGMRALFFAVDIVSALLLGTVFFSASGGVAGKRARASCLGASADLREQLGRLAAIGVGSVVFAGFPSMFLGSLHSRSFLKLPYEGCPEWERQLRIWRTQDRIVWCLGCAYLLLSAFFISTFLANISEADSRNWAVSGIISMVEDTIVIPLGVALTIPLLAILTLAVVSRVTGLDRREILCQRLAVMQRSNLTLAEVSI